MSMGVSIDSCKSIFQNRYGTSSIHVSAPGRANIIGEHTDYNQGFVLPFAIDRYIHFIAHPSLKSFSRIYSVNFHQEIILENNKKSSGFGGFLNACIEVLKDENKTVGSFDLVFGGDLPIGGGMSSSSAMCCGFVVALSQLFQLELTGDDILRIVIKAEKGVSVDGGIMDQFSIINSKKDHAILLDCLDNSTEFIPLKLGEYCFCLLDSGVSHNLQETAYNQRVLTCKTALTRLQNLNQAISGFRDVQLSDLIHLQDLEKRRMRHVITENERVRQSVEYLKSDNFERVGELLQLSHLSLKDNYEVSCPELDLIVSLLDEEKESLGARMMGGGFGGSVISIMKADSVEDIFGRIAKPYQQKVGIDLIMHKVRSSDGLWNFI